jgi:UDP-N-acetyl-D-galactosamine dehydrogenase
MSLKMVTQELKDRKKAIGVVGLGYVGLPLACLLAKKFKVVGFDINERRVAELQKGFDRTKEVTDEAMLLQTNLKYSTNPSDLGECPVIICAVPTPVDNYKKPDLSPVEAASRTVGQILTKGTIVVFESTVFPGVTEKICGPILEKHSKLKRGTDFFLGYSPERVNPGDKERTIDKITKVVAGENADVADVLCDLYGSVIQAGVHRAANIMTAEAAKVIENTQRDLNIGLINELATIFDEIGLDTNDVLTAAGTKWNFLPFKPGLVGGHCIGVDPYYLTHMAEGLGLHPQVISAGRRINDSMGGFVADKALRLILKSGLEIRTPLKVGILGATFKENVPDVRNTKVIDVALKLENAGVEVFFVDPIADADEFRHEYHRELTPWDKLPVCDAMVLAVQHEYFVRDLPLKTLLTKLTSSRILLDLKNVINRQEAEELGVCLWRL